MTNEQIALLERRIKEQDDEIHFLETSLTQRDAARIKKLENFLKEQAQKIQELKTELRSKEYAINELEIEVDRKRHDYSQYKDERADLIASEVAAAREIAAALPNPISETYEQFVFRRNLRTLFTVLGVGNLL